LPPAKGAGRTAVGSSAMFQVRSPWPVLAMVIGAVVTCGAAWVTL
jgi:hypothetical protein